MKNILIPTDFSENSWNAIKYGINYLKKKRCNFYLLHVSMISYTTGAEIPIIPSTDILEKTVLSQAKKSLKAQLEKIKDTFQNPKHHFFTVSTYNFFIEAIKEQIEEKGIDLIIMGTKGASGLQEVIIGSNAADLITRIKCPTLIIPENAQFKPIKEIAFPTDYNLYYHSSILDSIANLVKMFKSSLRILHVAKKSEELTSFQIENKELLEDFFAFEKHSFHKITNSKIEEGVQCFVESRDIDMIVMIAKNLNIFQRILFKPTVTEISYHTDIPFFVLHE
ncbi:MAG: universal stress protein [Lutibacter sp.]|uniref:universal stress protein n=1 Tax=Lutibacter sp. TaxID=1925666 RepID=UPI00299CDC73|nr:universal stress protein [Lutibacter sp.]MDX1828996.1 universal stress protein [Lutibacter sp.]